MRRLGSLNAAETAEKPAGFYMETEDIAEGLERLFKRLREQDPSHTDSLYAVYARERLLELEQKARVFHDRMNKAERQIRKLSSPGGASSPGRGMDVSRRSEGDADKEAEHACELD